MDAEEAEATCHCAWSPLTSLLLVLQLVLALVHAYCNSSLPLTPNTWGQIQAQLGVLLQLAMQRQRSQRVQALLAQRRVEVGYTCALQQHGGALVFF